ncbi:hypothetical protein, partial [Burkholderia multivorans]|uniref:hypothetical protein n=1 Tax=Burkholderia multivorans TaxID=87883 RepID=UPI0021C155A1
MASTKASKALIGGFIDLFRGRGSCPSHRDKIQVVLCRFDGTTLLGSTPGMRTWHQFPSRSRSLPGIEPYRLRRKWIRTTDATSVARQT